VDPAEKQTCNLRDNRISNYSYHYGFATIDYQEKSSRLRNSRGHSMATLVLTPSPEYQFHYTNMSHETQQLVEDSNLDGFRVLTAYKVMAILAGKMLPQAGAKVMAKYGLKGGLKAFGKHCAESVQTESSQIHRIHSHYPNLRITKRSTVGISRAECVQMVGSREKI